MLLRKIFIGGLSYETTDEKLRSYFGAYGTVTDAVVMKDPISRRSRGFGFITYADPGCVDRALAQPNHVLDNRRVEAKRAVPRAESARDASSTTSSRGGPASAASSSNGGVAGLSSSASSGGGAATKKIFVGGLHYETKDAEFKKYFSQYGKVVSAEVMFNRETNKSRGFGFVIFETEHSVDLVLQDGGHVLDGKSVEVKRAVPRTDAPPPSSSSSSGVPSVAIHTQAAVSTSRGSFSDDLSSTPKHLLSPRSNPPASPASPAPLASVGTFGGYAAAVRYGGGRVGHSSLAHGAPPGLGEIEAGLDGLTMDTFGSQQQHRHGPDQSRLFRTHGDGYGHHHHPSYLSQHEYVAPHQLAPQWQQRHQQHQPPPHWQQPQQQQQHSWPSDDHHLPLRASSVDSNVFSMFTPPPHRAAPPPPPPTAAPSSSPTPPPRWDQGGFQFGGLGGGFTRTNTSPPTSFDRYGGTGAPVPPSLTRLALDDDEIPPLRFGDPAYLGIDARQHSTSTSHPTQPNPTAGHYLYERHEDDTHSGGGYYTQYR
ncbi:hypothetical protein, variant 1 [Aphanomyces astaci]|uniref:RRM domain-containing protein n=1 Tax=Aphanomyces astaci TaxID=112090 RepID=W4GK83_APHAT|nr:hypothetical protein, variant 1 [Aphanomyces astaci]ETV79449.1 hypothetical protein, variant 1 [Aphanomyces astaci]|eukprot:XP_009831292.1 hypothetical protein, variant 1 [Aphanomyces astaci]